jgi:diguanylate cyclase (GGDEF)-like protein
MSVANQQIEPSDELERDSHYERWLFQSMLDELSVNELGIGFVYSVMATLAKRYSLRDIVIILSHESFGAQMFRLEGKAISADMAASVGTEPGVYCDPDIVPGEELAAVRTACQLAISLHLARFSAAHDPLTNIANRRTFDSSLEAAAARSSRYGWAFTLLVIDLNGFKNINDTLGHAIGDDLLRQFGVAMRRSVRSGDVAARIGGDEFAVILSNADGFEATGFVDRLRCNLKAASELLEFSVGTAVSPRDSTDPIELFRVADARLYEKKGLAH